MLVYLVTAGWWAASSVEELVAAYPPGTVALSTSQQKILFKIEDPNFLEHDGLSLVDGQGVTTITSSIARDVFLSGPDLPGIKGAFQSFYRAVFACCKKVDIGRDVMALVLDSYVAKQRQLDLYVAHVYMGNQFGVQAKGLEQASRLLFDKSLANLPEQDFISLVAMIKSPNQFHRIRDPQAFALRRERVASILAGTCQPIGWFDTGYESCKTAR